MLKPFAAVVMFALAAVPVAAQQATPVSTQPPPQSSPADQPVAFPAAPPQSEPGSDGFITKAKRWSDEHQLMGRLNGDVEGWYPKLGGMTRGSGFAIGPGYRKEVGGGIFIDASVGLSTKVYKTADLKVRWLQALDEKVEFWTRFRYEDFPQEDFFGIGPSSSEANRTSYDFDSNDITALGFIRPTPWLKVGAEVGYMTPRIGPGSDSKYPVLQEIFDDLDVPGLLEQPDFLHTTLFVDIDYRDRAGRPRSGGFYHVGVGFWDDRTMDRYNFKRFDANLQQYVPLDAGKKHVLLGRIGASYVNNAAGNRVPFYFLPYVGGVDTVRSFDEFRFKDENALWMTAEYNLTLMKWVSLAAFVDAGKVAPNWEQIQFSDLKKGYGFGARIHSNKMTFARVDFATGGGEGWTMFLKLVPSF